MSLIPWRRNPSERMGLMRPEFDRWVDQMFGEFPSWGTEGGQWAPAVTLSDTDKAVMVRAEIPGVEPKDIDISVTDNVLTLRGEKREERKEEKENFYRVERSFGSFVRHITLPSEVDPNRAEAKIEKGVLNLELPKIEGERRRSIKVNVK